MMCGVVWVVDMHDGLELPIVEQSATLVLRVAAVGAVEV